METHGPIGVDTLMERSVQAGAIFGQLDQEHTDRIVRSVFEAGYNQRIRLAQMAHEETKLGRWEDKVIKNVVATLLVYEDIRDQKTVGVISEDDRTGIVEIAQPLGPVFAITPVTNPTSTVLFKILISLKTRNPVIIKPHRNAARCSIEAARICYEAALAEDAPEWCIQWVEDLSRDETARLMAHEDLALVLATGGGGLVKAAYSSGTPALGVGAGNVPVYIEQSADVSYAVEQIFLSKTFDNGTVCASEQSIVVEEALRDQVLAEIKARNGYILSPDEISRLEPVAYDAQKHVMQVGIIGQSVEAIARMAGLDIPQETTLLVAPLEGVGEAYPLSAEILAPIIALYVVKDFDDAVKRCIDLNYYGGVGHSASLFSNDQEKISTFSLLMNAGRIMVNLPASQGAVGGIYNSIPPSFTLGCGSGGKNITTDNITARHLLNIQRITRRRMNDRFTSMPPETFFDESIDAVTISHRYNRNY